MKKHDSTFARAFLFSALGLLPAIHTGAADAGRDKIFREFIEERLRAFDRGDSAAYARLLAPDFVHVDDSGRRRTGAEILTYVAAHAGTGARHEVGSLSVRVLGKVAVADSQVAEYLPRGTRELSLPAHHTDVFIRSKNSWLFFQHAETSVQVTPSAIEVTPEKAAEFVGDYEWWPGYVETLLLHEGHLVVRDTGDPVAYPLQALSPETFAVPGEGTILVFVRNEHGDVVRELVHWPNGLLIEAPRRMREAGK